MGKQLGSHPPCPSAFGESERARFGICASCGTPAAAGLLPTHTPARAALGVCAGGALENETPRVCQSALGAGYMLPCAGHWLLDSRCCGRCGVYCCLASAMWSHVI